MNTDKPNTLEQVNQAQSLRRMKVYRQHPRWLVKKGDQFLWHLERKSGLRYRYQQRLKDVLAKWNEQVKAQEFWELDTDFTVASGKLIRRQATLYR